ncbi:MAG: hypothetical protein ACFFBE_04570 [Promethearchaeota archaeon]
MKNLIVEKVRKELMFVEEKKIKDPNNRECCSNCGSTLECGDYIYRRRSTFSGYLCAHCGFVEFYDNK